MNSWWQQVLATVQSEFADIGDIEQLTRVTLRLATAAILGGILGFEREHRGKAAGVRTHMLVSMGAALFVLAPDMAGADDTALSRVIQGIVAGIGFLGAGTILKEHAKNISQVKGLTTAAGLWMTAAIGVAAGMGREVMAILSTLLALGILSLVPHVVDRHEPKQKNHGDGAESGNEHADRQEVS
ncbi:MgtC/SapB family protein [Pseudomonas sp. 21LCFQ010]|uniref:MgtC/SapB family protein n=1 Tax=Pseudomonas sp. 21LCFQ010 TaxID=2957506 RepID=UPI002097349B|nr:MgtC/SapB family protein [Pseudomonas sp. 21LCFQ010]MCO8161926.1 MgtC/SapB family protein [Pseudomonas sp. 21LCFQ010]